MGSFLDLAATNLLSPMVLFFALGLFAAIARSGLAVPEAVAKALSLYLIMAIGLKGGHEVAKAGVSLTLFASLAAGMVLSFLLPAIAYFLLSRTTKLSQYDVASIAAHYGSISIVTFLAGGEALRQLGYEAEGYMVAVAAAMEAPAIVSGLWLAARGAGNAVEGEKKPKFDSDMLREVALNGSIVLLVGAFVIGAVMGKDGMAAIKPFVVDPFKGVLCLFLLDMGLVAGRGLRQGWSQLRPSVLVFGLYMPVIGASLGLVAGTALGISLGGTALFMVLGASASYIAVPAAMRLALPNASAAIPLTLSLGVTFPFNLILGIPIYIALASTVLGG